MGRALKMYQANVYKRDYELISQRNEKFYFREGQWHYVQPNPADTTIMNREMYIGILGSRKMIFLKCI